METGVNTTNCQEMKELGYMLVGLTGQWLRKLSVLWILQNKPWIDLNQQANLNIYQEQT